MKKKLKEEALKPSSVQKMPTVRALTRQFSVATLREAGYRVPEDISVIGEGDIKIFGFCSPPLTAITADYQEMVSRMVEFVDGAPMGNRKIFIPQHLVERKSVFNRLQIG